jgi:hypothetical protein
MPETLALRFRINTIKPAINTKNAIPPMNPAQYISKERRTFFFALVPPAIAPVGETLLLDDDELEAELRAPVVVLAEELAETLLLDDELEAELRAPVVVLEELVERLPLCIKGREAKIADSETALGWPVEGGISTVMKLDERSFAGTVEGLSTVMELDEKRVSGPVEVEG